MEVRIQIVAIVVSTALLLVVLELVRRRSFLERYAILWLFSGVVLLALAIWKGLLEQVAKLVGIVYPPNALFLIAFGFVLILLLHFSLAVSKLSDQTRVLAQRLALLEQRQRKVEGSTVEGDADELEGDYERLSNPRASERSADVSTTR